MNEEMFARLMHRYQNGNATPEERQLIEQWLESRSRKKMFGKLSPEEQNDMLDSMSHVLFARLRSDRGTGGSRRDSSARWFGPVYRAAAAVAVIAVASFLIVQRIQRTSAEDAPVHYTTISSAQGQHTKVLLRDGSIVWLKGRSVLTYPDVFSEEARVVVLEGEALFEVAKDPDHPFIIECGNLTATVLGTSFNIKGTSADVEVTVLTGKVALSSEGNDGIVVLPNEKALYRESGNRIEKVVVEEKEALAATAGTEYSMLFKAARIAEVIRRIEGKFNVKVSLANPGIGDCMITADFTDQSLDRTLDMISQSLGFEYKFENRTVTLDGAGCD